MTPTLASVAKTALLGSAALMSFAIAAPASADSAKYSTKKIVEASSDKSSSKHRHYDRYDRYDRRDRHNRYDRYSRHDRYDRYDDRRDRRWDRYHDYRSRHYTPYNRYRYHTNYTNRHYTPYRSRIGISFSFGNSNYSRYRWAPSNYSFYQPTYGSYGYYQSRTHCRRVTTEGWHHGHRELVSVQLCSNPWDGEYIVQGSERVINCPF